MRSGLIITSVLVGALAVTGATTPSYAAPLVVGALSPDYQSEDSLSASLWSPPEDADEQVSPGVNAPEEAWQPSTGGRFGVEEVSPEDARAVLQDYVEQQQEAAAEKKRAAEKINEALKATTDPRVSSVSVTPVTPTEEPASPQTPAEESTPAPDVTAEPSPSPSVSPTPSPSPTATKTPEPAPQEKSAEKLTAEQQLEADDGAVTPMRAPSGTVAGAPGLGALPYFSFDQFSVSDDTVIRVNRANGNLLITASDAILTGPGVGLRADRFYNGLSTDSGIYGGGWSSSVASYDVGVDDAGSTVTFLGPAGIRVKFTRTGPGQYSSPVGFDGTLTKDVPTDPALTCTSNPDWCYTLTYNKSGEQLKFSRSGFLTGDFDRNGVGTTYSYNGGILTGAYQASGRSMAFDFKPASGPQTMTDSANRTISFEQNASFQLSKVTSPDGAVNEYTYDSTGRLATMKVPGTNPTSTTITFGYDSSHRVTSITQQASSPTWGSKSNLVTNYSYTSGLTTVTDPRGNALKYAIDSAGRVTSTTDALNRKHAQVWNSASRVASTTDALGSGSTPGNQTTYAYDQLANTTGATMPTGAAAQAIYAQGSNCPSVTSGTAYQVKCSIDASGQSTKYEYDAAGNATKEINTTNGFNGVIGERTYSTGASGQCSPVKGQICTSKDGRGAVTSFLYDTSGNLKKVTPPSPMPVTTYEYDSLGRVVSVRDGRLDTTRFAYDLADRQVKTTFNNNDELWAAYYPNGTKQYDWDRTRYQTTYDYDRQGLMTAKNSLTHTTNPTVENIKMQYDAAGNMTRYEDARGAIIYGYNNVNELRWLNQAGSTCTDDDALLPAGSECIKFRYNANGAETERYLPGQAKQIKELDKSGRIKRVAATSTNASNLVTTDIDIRYEFNSVKGSTAPASDTSKIQWATTVKQQGIPANAVTQYAYDHHGFLRSAAEKVGSAFNATWDYGYDDAGNRTYTTLSGAAGSGATDWTYNAANQLVSTSRDATTWTYDGAGNQTRNGRTSVTSTYNDRGQVTLTSGIGYSAYGAGNSEPISRTNGGITYRSSPLGLAHERTSATTTAFTRLPDGEIVGTRTGNNRNYFITDYLGSVVGLYSGAVGGYLGGYSYSPYGEARATGTNSAVIANPIRYISGYWDAPSGLYKFGARFYDPSIARFTQMDPSGQEPNAYWYAFGEPIGSKDPSGMAGWEVYGNWCGPGSSGPDDPIDTLDSLCQQHDMCYGANGYFNFYCDQELVAGIWSNWDDFEGWTKFVAGAIAAVFFG